MSTNHSAPVYAEFDLPLFLPRVVLPKCEVCGGEYQKKQPYQRFCSTRCKLKLYNKIETERLRQKVLTIQQLPELVPAKKATAREQQIADLFNEGWPWKAVAKKLGVNPAYVRKTLIKLNLYRPNPRHNGTAKKGTGPNSKKPNDAELERRNKETESEKASKLARLREMSAACIRGLRIGVGVGTTCRERSFPFSTVYTFLSQRNSYKKLSYRLGESAKAIRRQGAISMQFKNEKEMQAEIAAGFGRLNAKFVPEFQIKGTRTRADFLFGKHAIEAKLWLRATETQKAIGQCSIYLGAGYIPVLVIPDDISIFKFGKDALDVLGAIVFHLRQFPEFIKQSLAGGDFKPIVNIREYSRAKSADFICRCCLCSGVNRSYSPSGSPRSYCKDCEPGISSKRYDYASHTWVDASPRAIPGPP